MNEDYPIFLGSEFEQPDPQKSLFHILPVPYEKTVSYGGGTAKGPSSILKASWQLEEWDDGSKPSDAGIFTAAEVDCSEKPEEVIKSIAKSTQNILEQGAIPIILGKSVV